MSLGLGIFHCWSQDLCTSSRFPDAMTEAHDVCLVDDPTSTLQYSDPRLSLTIVLG
jgi:hypothetical protein